jgi:phospholipase C
MKDSSAGVSLIDHIVVLMLENRSFDHMLGYLYHDRGNLTEAGHEFDGLTGNESNPAPDGTRVEVFPISPSTANGYFMPGANPGEGFQATNNQMYASYLPSQSPAPMTGFVTDFAHTLAQPVEPGRSIIADTTPDHIMGCFTPEMLPILSGLARGYAVCDRWFGSAPTQTMPNRSFALCGTSQGRMDDRGTFTAPTIFRSLTHAGVEWGVYGYTVPPLTRHSFVDLTNAPDDRFGLFEDFKRQAATGTLPAFAFLEPAWDAAGNSQHPNYDVALGEQLIHEVYYTLFNSPAWARTLLIVTYDEHGGCFDHVPPPHGAATPDDSAGEFGFDFTRFGPRVPAVLVSPLIPRGTVFRAPADTTPMDHTSILRTVEERWGLPSLTARDAAAYGLGAVLALREPRTDDPLNAVPVPASGGRDLPPGEVSHLQQLHVELLAKTLAPGTSTPPLQATSDDLTAFIIRHAGV